MTTNPQDSKPLDFSEEANSRRFGTLHEEGRHLAALVRADGNDRLKRLALQLHLLDAAGQLLEPPLGLDLEPFAMNRARAERDTIRITSTARALGLRPTFSTFRDMAILFLQAAKKNLVELDVVTLQRADGGLFNGVNGIHAVPAQPKTNGPAAKPGPASAPESDPNDTSPPF